jgi:hypothetical protein
VLRPGLDPRSKAATKQRRWLPGELRALEVFSRCNPFPFIFTFSTFLPLLFHSFPEKGLRDEEEKER